MLFLSLYVITHASITQAVLYLKDEIQTFLLEIGQEEYMLNIMNGIRWQIKMNQSSLCVMKERKRIVASRIYNKRKNKNQPPKEEEETSPNLSHMSTEERELYELPQLMGTTEDMTSKISATGRD